MAISGDYALIDKGFDMTAMNQVYFNEGLVEYVDAKEVVTDECIVRVGSIRSLRGRTITVGKIS